MTTVLRHLPFDEQEDEVSVGLERIAVKPYQIIVWVSLTSREIVELPPQAARFPAILDTGYNHNFSIQEGHLRHWAKLDPTGLPRTRGIREQGRSIPLYGAHVWLRPNSPGKRDEEIGAAPFRLGLDRGIAVYPDELRFPRVPLLGLRALVRNKLHLSMDPERRTIQLRTPDWHTRLLQLLS